MLALAAGALEVDADSELWAATALSSPQATSIRAAAPTRDKAKIFFFTTTIPKFEVRDPTGSTGGLA